MTTREKKGKISFDLYVVVIRHPRNGISVWELIQKTEKEKKKKKKKKKKALVQKPATPV
jgi:hypothetical protein